MTMPARMIMIQGTGSYVGKSVVTAAFCSYFRQEGFRVAPFKAQNMSNNSFVTADGGEMGRAQVFQAQACGIEPRVEMNPILLKPGSDIGAQVVVLGKAVGVMSARDYHQYQPQLLGIIRDSLDQLSRQHDFVVIEGAGSPAEVNLRPFDIVNMAVARMAAAPVILVGDINLGGVFAWLVGTLELLTSEERSMVKAFLINKFRGDLSLLKDGLDFLEERTGKKVLGVLPFLKDLAVAEEDSLPDFKWKAAWLQDSTKLGIQVILLPHISNSTDFDSLETEPDVALHYVTSAPPPREPLPDLLIIPGSKSAMSDLAYLKSSRIAQYVRRCHESRVPVVGICGGYQMLGQALLDPLGVESSTASMEGLGLLDTTTIFEPQKTTVQVRGVSLDGEEEIVGYEIHMGRSEASNHVRPMFRITEESGKPVDRLDGTVSSDGLVWGTYLHGVFDAAHFRRRILNELRLRRNWEPLSAATKTSTVLDTLATLIRCHVDLATLNQILSGDI
ncbi:MAG TPA: cobyric acid synthase [Terriglobia bacterium]|nr:cobyric acid synthase [Terriglobia bacterium]